MEDTYVLEINYADSEKEYSKNIWGVGTFWSHLYSYYWEKAHELAETFCKNHWLIINNNLNSWPSFQAVVSKELEVHKIAKTAKEEVDSII